MRVETVDYHTGGEPFRIVTTGVERLRGDTILDKRRFAVEHLDDVRKLLVFEPRGHADMYGGFVVEPHVAEPHRPHVAVLDLRERLDTTRGHVDDHLGLAVRGVDDAVLDRPRASFVHATGVEVTTSRGRVRADISFGGAFYASVHAPTLGLTVDAPNLPAFIALGREIKAAIEAEHEVVHVEQDVAVGERDRGDDLRDKVKLVIGEQRRFGAAEMFCDPTPHRASP